MRTILAVLLLGAAMAGQNTASGTVGNSNCPSNCKCEHVGGDAISVTCVQPEPIDVPDSPVRYPIKSYDWSMCAGALVTEHGIRYCAIEHGCPDLDRILMGPDGHGRYFCHLPQTGGEP